MDNKRFLSLVGLCKKAGCVTEGLNPTVELLKRKGAVSSVFISSDASDRTRKVIRDKTDYYGVRLYETGICGADIGKALGIRSDCAVFALGSKGPVSSVISLFET